MRAREIITIDRVNNYYDSIIKMRDLTNIQSMNINDFSTFIDEENNIFITTTLPIPSCRCFKVEMENRKGIIIPVFYYKIFIKGSFENDFKKFLFDGAMNTYSIYGPVYELTVFKDKTKNDQKFQITFNSLNALYDILQTQRICDFNFRYNWLEDNIDKVVSDITEYNKLEDTKKNLLVEIKQHMRTNNELKQYFSVGKKMTLPQANSDLAEMRNTIKKKRKYLCYPKFVTMKEMNVTISQNKVRVVSFSKDDNGEYIFYYYK